MSQTVLVTGGAGFIGSNFVHMLVELRPDWRIVNFDALTYAGNLENLAAVEGNAQYTFVHGDVRKEDDVERAFAAAKGSGRLIVVHFAAESHVDRSILSGLPFVTTNIAGTQVLLDAARRHGIAGLLSRGHAARAELALFRQQGRERSPRPRRGAHARP